AYQTSCQIIKSINEKLSSIFIYESGNVDIPILSTIDICSNQEHICCEFSGLSFSPSCKHIKCFTEMIEPIDILISTHDRFPIFLRQLQYNCEIFFLSTDIQDINEKLRADFKIKEYFLGIVPLLMYLNHIIPDIFKHVIKRATIIIDDPLLHANYGFLNYNKLISLMEKHTFFTTVAFIPWNYKRSDIQIVNLFLNNKNLIGLCVHGCDHTKCEFSNTNLKHLNKLVKLATARMMEHEKITDLPFDKVMVFPQGKFSNQAIQTLKENNYIAAINTSPTSTNLNELFEVKDFIKPYISKYHGFPLFTRNTPEDIIDISFNLFLGKPVFLVIHHDYLKDNYKKLISAVSYINSRTKYIQWDGVGNIIDAILNTVSIKDVVGLSSINTYDIYGYKEKIYIFFRRKASEFRDNYLSKNKVILEIANSIKKIFKL
ncbi:MAG: hypothetical protein ACXWEW_11470, partial [Nitrososphaeraceae archaeon]